ncbi:MAG: monovalent cation/H+ antiporter subunit A [Burkholderiales bacterium]
MSLILIIALPLLLGPLFAFLGARFGRSGSAWAVAAVAAAALALVLAQAGAVIDGTPLMWRWQWLPEAGLNLSLRLDGLALLFVLLILAIGLLVILYARYYLSPEDSLGRFYAILMVFMAAMLGIVTSDNLLVLAVFWELTGVTSFLLIGYWGNRVESRQGARMALAITGGGGLAMLAGFLLLGEIAGTYEISELIEKRELIHEHALYVPMLLLVLLGAFTKSAQFPFHAWLPEAMAAPTPVSAYLHSATMVKAGVFLIARMYPILGQSAVFEYTVCAVGLTTMVFAAYVAVFKHDLKGLLAYSTISHLGLITFLLGLDSPLSALAAVFHIVNHAIFKASLFMAAGIIDHEAGTRDMRRLGGLWRHMPHTATLAMVAAAAMAGVPLLNGFLSKEMFFAEALELDQLGLLGEIAPYAVVAGGAFGVAYSLRFIHDVFFHGDAKGLPRTPHEPPRWMKVPVEILVALCILVGVLPGLTVATLVDVAGASVFGAALPPHDIAIFHGFNLPLAMSALALVLGALMYWVLLHRLDLHLHVPSGWTGRLLFTRAVDGLVAICRLITDRLENGSLQRYLALMIGFALVAGTAPFIGAGDVVLTGPQALMPANAFAWALWLVLVAAALGAVLVHRQRLAAVILVAVVGLAVSIAFVYLSAPDLALTQISVEVVATVLLLMALALLPATSEPESGAARRLRDAGLAAGAGLGVGLLAWAVMTRPLETVSWFFVDQSVPGGGGTNMVNVILVDFRGFDTLGEITVLAIAAIGVAALLDGLRVPRAAPRQAHDAYPLILATASNVMLPLTLMVSAYIFLRGHNDPGGGFIAGLVTAIGLVTQYIADGYRATGQRFNPDYARVAGAGIAVAGATGIGAWFYGAPFLTSAHGYAGIPLLGSVPLASAIAFDLGVYLVVVGATLLMLVALAGAGEREAAA